MPVPRFARLIYSLLALAVFPLLTAGTAQAQIDLANIQATGTEKITISIQDGPTLEYEGPITLAVDEDETATLTGTMSIQLYVDDDEKKIYAAVRNWNSLERQIEDVIGVDPRLIFASVDADFRENNLSQKFTAKLKRNLDLKIGVSFPFIVRTGITERKGKFKLTASATEARPPACEGGSYDGVESFKLSAKGAGSLKSKDKVASLDLDSETTPFDELLGFTYTNPSAMPNATLTGSIDYTGKKPVIVLDAGSVANLEENLEAIILDIAQLATTVTVGATKTSFKCGKSGDRARFSYSADLTIDDGQQILSGKVTLKNKMGLD